MDYDNRPQGKDQGGRCAEGQGSPDRRKTQRPSQAKISDAGIKEQQMEKENGRDNRSAMIDAPATRKAVAAMEDELLEGWF